MTQKVTIEVEDEHELETLLLCVQTMKMNALKEKASGEAEMINEDLINRFDSFIDQLHAQGATSGLDEYLEDK